ncbi:MAG: MTH1187 family thiamine-binding protein [candidate division WOR-3 bacterium]
MTPRPIVEFSVVPVGTGSTSVSHYVRVAHDIVKQSGLDHQLNPMGTCLQGDWDKIFATIRKVHDTLATMGCGRIVTTIKIDDRRDKDRPMQAKVDRVLKSD